MAAESVFMRNALLLAPTVALLWVRPLVALRPPLALLAALALVSEPLYASWQTRVLLAGDDAREQVERRLAEEAPAGAWLLHIPPFIGNVRVVHPGLAYSHERRFLLSYPYGTLSTPMRCSASVRICLHYMLPYRQKGLKRSGLVRKPRSAAMPMSCGIGIRLCLR